MSDVDALLSAFDAGELLMPSVDVPNIVDLGNAISRLAGVEGTQPTPNSHAIEDLIGPSKHLVLVAADGLGMNTVESMDRGAFIPRHVVQTLQTVFPSSTPVVFASLATGVWPSTHARHLLEHIPI